jgi:hypothetical protein
VFGGEESFFLVRGDKKDVDVNVTAKVLRLAAPYKLRLKLEDKKEYGAAQQRDVPIPVMHVCVCVCV